MTQLARLHLALMLTLNGTPFLYNGEEIGMTDLLLTDIAQFRDLLGHLGLPAARDQLEAARGRSRSSARPRPPATSTARRMQWANAANAGFSPAGVAAVAAGQPELRRRHQRRRPARRPGSLLSFYRQMLRVRKQTPALIAGGYIPLHEEADGLSRFPAARADGGQTCLVVLNFSDRPQTLRFDLPAHGLRPLFASGARAGRADDLSALVVGPYEVYIGELALH